MTVSLSTAARNAKLDALNAFLGPSPLLRIYAGTAPGGANSALGPDTLLAELVMGVTPFAPAAGGSITANPITGDLSADASGIATFYRVYRADGTTCVIQGGVGTGLADLVLNTTSIVATAPVTVVSFVYTEGSP